MNFDPFQFYGDGNNGIDDYFGGMYGYSEPSGYANSFYWIIGLTIAAIVIGIIVNATFLRRKNEGRFHGFWGRVYNCFSLNRFYSEGIIKLLSVVTFFVLTILGIYWIFNGSVFSGIMMIVFGNLGARICYELLMMFIIFCKKSVSIDKRLSTIEKYYDEGEEWVDENSMPEAEPVFEPEPIIMPVVEPETEQAAEDVDELKTELNAEAEPGAQEDPDFKKKLEEALGDPNAPKYGYDEECKTCDNWNEEDQDCYCLDDCLTCDKPDKDKEVSEVPESKETDVPEEVPELDETNVPEEVPEISEETDIKE